MRTSGAGTSSGSTRQNGVANMLHTLRGEQFRHSQNQLQSRTHLSSTHRIHAALTAATTGTLPTDLILSPPSSSSFVFPTAEEEETLSKYNGERAGTTTRHTTQQENVHGTPAWRARALSIVLGPPNGHGPEQAFLEDSNVPPLTTLCLRYLTSFPKSVLIDDVFPYLPSHLRRLLIRDSAVHAPLPDALLYPLLEDEGGADGELVVVGPSGTIRDGHFGEPRTFTATNTGSSTQGVEMEDEWDAPEHEYPEAEPIHTLALISARLTVTVLLTLPPTLTHIALVHLPSPVPIHRLPPLLPRLTVFDLSYNEWLGYRPPEQESSSMSFKTEDGILLLERVEWSKWRGLKVLGLRECIITLEVVSKVNKGRWDDVQIVQ
ncbi:hypothetical protein HGRIS_012817 [Hohenbuehelia grisea]|uniref:Uncharacterized protein n=1 Tax=Hohenbuehelia grisea TaxID=104357 RepID=A0ABR3ITF9_9AGAR